MTREERGRSGSPGNDGEPRDVGRDAERIVDLARAVLPQDGPGPAVRARIREYAEAQVGPVRLRWMLARWGTPLAAAAAVALALIPAWQWTSGHADRRVRLASTLVAAVTESEAHEETAVESAEDLKSLARQLLILEGLAVDEESIDVTDPEASGAERPPTAIQGRNTPAYPAQRCG